MTRKKHNAFKEILTNRSLQDRLEHRLYSAVCNRILKTRETAVRGPSVQFSIAEMSREVRRNMYWNISFQISLYAAYRYIIEAEKEL